MTAALALAPKGRPWLAKAGERTRARKRSMSGRPSVAGLSPPPGPDANTADSTPNDPIRCPKAPSPTLLIVTAAHPLAASRSQRWRMAVKSSRRRPGRPNSRRSQMSLRRSSSASPYARATRSTLKRAKRTWWRSPTPSSSARSNSVTDDNWAARSWSTQGRIPPVQRSEIDSRGARKLTLVPT
ncbi:MAG: hypothetical protein QOF30_30 [Acidimicrobiaceae bacterium]|nr:hypothetical protein [Acidimicrobiaceae bacterium]